jgi:hypothetical protein
VIVVGQRVLVVEHDGPMAVTNYGTVSTLIPGHVIVQFDGEHGARPIRPDRCRALDLEAVRITLSDIDLVAETSLRGRLVDLWLAEVERAAMPAPAVHRLGDGLAEGADAIALAEIVDAGVSLVLGARRDGDQLVVAARRPNRWD